MLGYDLYSLILCFIVFVLLVSVSVVMITTIAKLTLKTIKCGAEDEKIKKGLNEYKKSQLRGEITVINSKDIKETGWLVTLPQRRSAKIYKYEEVLV